jgi:chromosomal replication initiation ATPase DnaA
MLPRMERSPAEAVELVDRMDRLALAKGTAITRTIAAEALRQREEQQAEAANRSDLEADDE